MSIWMETMYTVYNMIATFTFQSNAFLKHYCAIYRYLPKYNSDLTLRARLNSLYCKFQIIMFKYHFSVVKIKDSQEKI